MGFPVLISCWLCHWQPTQHTPLARPAPPRAEEPAPPIVLTGPPRPERQPTTAEPAPVVPVKRAMLPDAVVVQVMDVGRAALFGCVKRARDREPNLGTIKIELKLEIDAEGAVTAATAELEDTRLQNCLTRVARGLHFPAPGVPAAAALAFFAQ